LLLKLGIKEVGIFLLKTAKFSNFKDKQPFVKKNHIDSLNDRKIIGCRKNSGIWQKLLQISKYCHFCANISLKQVKIIV
jgi:hypothetical protein